MNTATKQGMPDTMGIPSDWAGFPLSTLHYQDPARAEHRREADDRRRRQWLTRVGPGTALGCSRGRPPARATQDRSHLEYRNARVLCASPSRLTTTTGVRNALSPGWLPRFASYSARIRLMP